MKKAIILLLSFVLLACGKDAVEKPDDLLTEDQMVDIFYDLALLEAIRTQKPQAFSEKNLAPEKYIYKKYKIDSTRFANSNRYYASDVKQYKELHERVAKRIERNMDQVNRQLGNNPGTLPPQDPDTPQIR